MASFREPSTPRFKHVPLELQNEILTRDIGDVSETLQQEAKGETPHFRLTCPDRESLKTDYEKEVFDKVVEFTRTAAEEMRSAIAEEFTHVEFTSSPERKRDFYKYIQDHNLDYPEFTYLVGMEALEHLYEIGLYDGNQYDDEKYRIEKGNPFNTLIFKLPKQLDQFWKKDLKERGDSSTDVGAHIIPWGHIYREVIPVLWRLRDEYEESGELNLDRINENGDHKIGEYYYAWIGKTPNE